MKKGGGGSKTTSRVIPGQTPNESYLENGLTSWEDYDHIKKKQEPMHAVKVTIQPRLLHPRLRLLVAEEEGLLLLSECIAVSDKCQRESAHSGRI